MKVSIRRAVAAAVLGAALVAPVAPGAATPAATKPRAAGSPAAPANRLSAAMPDSVLARVFTGTGPGDVHLVTRNQWSRAAARAGRQLDTITPQERREFLDVLLDQAVLVARVKREPRQWEHRDSSDWNALRDRLVLRAALDSAMVALNFERAARGDSLLGPQELGIALRDRAVVQLAPRWNDKALEKAVSVFDTLPRPDSRMSMIEQMRVAGVKPAVGEADGALVLAESGDGRYTLAELVGDYSRLNPIYRPHVSTVDHVKELVSNALFEARLRREAAEHGFEHRPGIAAQLSERAEYLDVARFVTREVYAKIALDSLVLRRHYEATRSIYDIEERAHLLRMTFPRREDAEAMVKRLTVPNEAESLATQSARAGVPYASILAAANDSALFGRLKRGGVGAVLGPDSTVQGWRAVRVMSFEPRRHRTFAEAEPLVKQSWYDHEGERLMRDLLDGLRRRAVVVVNERGLARPIPPARVVGPRR